MELRLLVLRLLLVLPVRWWFLQIFLVLHDHLDRYLHDHLRFYPDLCPGLCRVAVVAEYLQDSEDDTDSSE